ncbi:regulator of sirC expression with transglutaminase-like and TPR domain [Sphingomonas sp. PvP055]|uniref:transglutaminase-like domain-containing protein n=1 Tax=Sphingomonas sp. PvP055 TaxID=3156391 RepID=UPI003396C044
MEDDDLVRLGLVDDDEIILDEAALALALLDHPETDDAPYLDLFQAITEALEEAAATASAAEPDSEEQAELLAQVIGGAFGFLGDRDTYDDSANADLIRVLDRRRGLPVSLSILYVSAARRMGWMANALDVPGHVLVLIGDEAAPIMIDPFRGGERVSQEQLVTLLKAMHPGEGPAVRHVAAMPNRAVLVRLLLNQAKRAEAAGQGRRALTLFERMTVMAPAYPHAWWELARLQLVDGDIPAARKSLSAMLEITREPDLRARISETLGSLPAA